MAALDIIASELLKSANEADLNYKKTRDQAQRDKAVRLRKIVENLKLLTTNPTLDQVLTAGNTSTNTLDVGGITTDYVQLDTTATPTLQPGMFAWNDQDGTANLRLKGGNVTLQVGQETLARVVNKTGADLLESQYKVVRVRIASEGGSQGQRLAVVLAQGNNDPDSVTTLGIVTETILNNQEGFITIFGNVNGINTTGSLQGETWVDGDVLFLSPTTPGALTKVKPVAPNHTVVIGYVIYAHGVNGKIFVKVDNGYELDELHNVRITAVANNDLLQYDSVQQVWKNVAASVAVPTPTLAQVTTAGNTTTNAITVGGLTSNGNVNVGGNFVGNILSNQYVHFTGGGTGEYRFVNGAGGGWFFTWCQNSGSAIPPTERMRLSSNNNLLIGTATDSGYRLDVNGTARINSSLYVSDPSFTGSGRFYQAANATTIISGGPAGENITFGPSNRVFINAGQSRFPGGSVQIAASLTLGSLNATGTNMLLMQGSVTASSALGRGIGMDTTLVAAANNDVLVGLDINPTFTNGAFTGVSNWGLRMFNSVRFQTDSDLGQGIYWKPANDGTILRIYGSTYSAGIGYLQLNVQSGGDGLVVNGGTRTLSINAAQTSIALNLNNITFNTHATGEAMRIVNTTKNVLVGTTTDAGYKLDVNGRIRSTGTNGLILYDGTYGAKVSMSSYFFTIEKEGTYGPSTYLFKYSDGTSALSLSNNTTILGIGGGDDAVMISRTVYAPHNAAFGFTTYGGTTKYKAIQALYTDNNTSGVAFNYKTGGTDTEAMRITSAGYIGVGTTTPTDIFHIVNNTNGNKFARISAGAADASAAWVAQNDQVDNIVYRVFGSGVAGFQMGIALARSASLIANLDGTGKFLIGTYSNTDIIFGTGDQSRIRVSGSNGNVMIGTLTDIGAKLNVSGDVNALGYRVNNVVGYTGILNIPGNPPGQQNVDIQGGIIVNIF